MIALRATASALNNIRGLNVVALMQRWAQSKFASHAEALVREEEKGYAKGVADTLAMPEDERAELCESARA